MTKEEISRNLEEIKTLLKRGDNKLLNFVEAAQYLSISHSQLYKYTSQRKIPFHKPAGKYLYFFRHELDQWITRNDECRLSNGEQNNKKSSPQSGIPLGEDGSQKSEEDEETEPP